MPKKKPCGDNRGMALVICLLVMMVLAMIGIGISTDSGIELKINGNLKDKTVTFQNADAGCSAAPEIIEDNLEDTRASAPYTYSSSGADPIIKVNIKDFNTLTETLPSSPQITIRGSDNTSDVNLPLQADIYVTKTGHLSAGNAIQMAAGYEGLGKGAGAGGFHVYFHCRSRCKQGAANTTTEIFYRHVSR